MPKMKEHEFVALLGQLESDAVTHNGEYMRINESLLSNYFGDPYGDEQPDQSQVVSMDVQDTVEADMCSLMRVFGSDKQLMIFDSLTSDPQSVQEAREKTDYINWLVNSQENSYQVKYNWIKDAEIQKIGVVRVDYEEKEIIDAQEYEGLSEEEAVMLMSSLDGEEGDSELTAFDDGSFGVEFKVKRIKKCFNICNIPTDNFLISRASDDLELCPLVGDRTRVTRSHLISMGYDEDLVRSLASATKPSGDTGARGDKFNNTRAGSLRHIRYQDQGGDDTSDEVAHWASQEVELSNLYVRLDYDGDGIAELRHVLKSGNTILENDAANIAPYAVMSSVPMPHDVIGRSRAELVQQTQRVKTVLMRQILDNVYRVNNGRVVVNDDVTNLDDLLTVRPNGIVRTQGDPMTAVGQLSTPYIGDKALQVVQYVDSVREQSTGVHTANQGLDSDQLYSETATRFLGIQEQHEAKIELVARNIAEIGFRRLYMVLMDMVRHFQDDAVEIMVLGKPLTVDPRKWKHESRLCCSVGLGVGDNDNLMQNMGALLSIDQQLQAQGSTMVDQKKTYNKLARMVRAMGISDVSQFYNDPEMPDEVLLAQNEQLMALAENLQAQMAQMQNPLAEAETIKAQKDLIEAQGKLQQEAAKLQEQMRQFNERLAEDKRQYNGDLAVELTKIEAETNKNVPGSKI